MAVGEGLWSTYLHHFHSSFQSPLEKKWEFAINYVKTQTPTFPTLQPWNLPLQPDHTRGVFSANMGLAPARPTFRSILPFLRY